ncbi:Transcription initiation factor TFIID subunit 5, partial [Tulasnella sp. 427]
MSSPASSKQGSQEPGTPLETDAPNALPDVPPAVPQGTSATEQNMTAVQILRNRGMHDAADVLEQALRAGNAGTDPVVVVNDPGSGEEGEGKDKDAMQEDAKPLAKRRASARIAKQSQHATMSVQEMATKSAPKGVAAAAAQAAAPSTSAAATATTASSTTTGKKGGRGKSPAARSPTVATSKGGAKQADATGSTAAEPSADAGADLSWVNDAIGALSAFVSSSTKQQAAGAPLTPDEAAPQMSPELLAALSRAGMTIEEALARDPTDKQRGYKELEEWVDGALDMYRPEFRPILFPMFLYFYLELVQQAHSEAAQHFFETYSPPLMSSHAAIVNHLKSIKLPHLLGQDELAQRYLDEKYVIRMSRSAFGLLLGWLMEGSGGEAMG